DVYPVDAQRVVEVGDPLRVWRPDGVAVEPFARDLDRARFSLAVLAPDVQLILSALVGEPGDRPAIRAPCRIAIVDAGGVRQVANVSLLAGDGDDLAAIPEQRTRARRRQRRIADPARAADVARPHLA